MPTPPRYLAAACQTDFPNPADRSGIADRVSRIKVYKDYRGYERPSDHVPVTATFELN